FTHRQARFNLFMQGQDREYAIRHFGLKPDRCLILPYGIEWQQPPAQQELEAAGEQLRKTHGIGAEEYIILFNGIFNYPPNLNALNRIVDTINPLLQQKAGFRYRIIVCGRDIPPRLTNGEHRDIIFAGFVDDISLYFKGADVFINPIIEGGGIKTKLVEALGYNLTSVSTKSGAIGIDPGLCNGKLMITSDDDWDAFCNYIVAAASVQANTPSAYFDYFYWGNSVDKVVRFFS
ncbi:MAG: glycosyltransferase family 4 protein, partial [Chitinophagaceae bacterium]